MLANDKLCESWLPGALREELRQRLEMVPGVQIPSSRVALRPSFPLTMVATADGRSRLLEALDWFTKVANAAGRSE